MSDVFEEITRRKETADIYFSNYVKTSKENELGKASEFLYGVITNLVYALGLMDNVSLGDHGKMKAYLSELATSRGDEDMANAFLTAEAMHANFYHNYMSKELFESRKGEVEGLATKLANLLQEKLNKTTHNPDAPRN